jgi:diguanylate cyclase
LQEAGTADAPRAQATVFGSARARAALPRRVYRYRVLGMGLGALAIAVVLLELRSGPLPWALCVFTGLLWPQLAYWRARRSASPFRAEQANLIFDSALVGLWVPLLHFNLLPSMLLVALSAADKINTDIPGLLPRTLAPSLAALLVGGLATGFAFAPESSTAVILACMPMLLIHTTAVSLTRLKLVRKIVEKNGELDRLGRTDTVTGLSLRRHWEESAAAALHETHAESRPAALLLIDVDGFKQVNDRHGHVAGDALLRAAGSALGRALRPGDIAGRYGGDEFAVVCPGTTLHDAAAMGEAYRAAVEAITVPQAPGITFSVSVGVTPVRPEHARIEDWIQAADAALYEAKRLGRNRLVVARASPSLARPGTTDAVADSRAPREPQGDSIA